MPEKQNGTLLTTLIKIFIAYCIGSYIVLGGMIAESYYRLARYDAQIEALEKQKKPEKLVAAAVQFVGTTVESGRLLFQRGNEAIRCQKLRDALPMAPLSLPRLLFGK